MLERTAGCILVVVEAVSFYAKILRLLACDFTRDAWANDGHEFAALCVVRRHCPLLSVDLSRCRSDFNYMLLLYLTVGVLSGQAAAVVE